MYTLSITTSMPRILLLEAAEWDMSTPLISSVWRWHQSDQGGQKNSVYATSGWECASVDCGGGEWCDHGMTEASQPTRNAL